MRCFNIHRAKIKMTPFELAEAGFYDGDSTTTERDLRFLYILTNATQLDDSNSTSRKLQISCCASS